MPIAFWFCRGLALALLLGICGCGSGEESLASVRGKVTYKGATLSSGTIVFIPDANRGGDGPMAQGEIQSDGTYVLKSGDSEGVQAGWYKVTVAALERATYPSSGQAFAVPRSLLPEKYRDPDLSGLTCEVKASKKNGINFNLD